MKKKTNPNQTTPREWAAYLIFIAGLVFASQGEAHYERSVEALKQVAQHNTQALNRLSPTACTTEISDSNSPSLQYSRMISSDAQWREFIPLTMKKTNEGYLLTYLESKKGELVQGTHHLRPFHRSPFQGKFSNLFKSDPRIHADTHLDNGPIEKHRSLSVAVKKNAHKLALSESCYLVGLAEKLHVIERTKASASLEERAEITPLTTQSWF